MGGQFVEALCGKCHVPLEPVIGNDAKDRFACPRCGISDTRDNILWEVSEHTREVAARHLQESMRRAARADRTLAFRGKPIPRRSYRFIGDLKL